MLGDTDALAPTVHKASYHTSYQLSIGIREVPVSKLVRREVEGVRASKHKFKSKSPHVKRSCEITRTLKRPQNLLSITSPTSDYSCICIHFVPPEKASKTLAKGFFHSFKRRMGHPIHPTAIATGPPAKVIGDSTLLDAEDAYSLSGDRS